MTTYMTEESEHYMGRLKVDESLATSFGPESDTKDKHTTRPGLPRANFPTNFAEAKNVTRFLLALGP
jgi:hypothetical protein